MKRAKIIICIGLTAAVCFSGQYLIESKHRFLGYLIGIDPIQQNVNDVPDGQSGVTALTVGLDGNVYGGTSSIDGKAPYVFMFSHASNLVTANQSLGKKIKGQSRINNALVTGKDGYIYGGTSVYVDKLYVPVKNMRKKGYKGGHLFRFKEGKVNKIENLGIVLANDGIRTLAIDPKRKKIYGLTEPGYKFFIYDMKNKKTVVDKKVDLLEEKDNTYNNKRLVKLGRALAVADDGKVYGSAYESLLFCYDPDKNKLEVTDITYPYVQAHEEINAISSFAKAKDGIIYGGTYTDGILFKFNSKTREIVNLGKPSSTTFVRSLVVKANGTVCGVVGDNGFPTQVFEYKDGGYHIVGEIRCTIFKTDYNWYASDLCPAVYMPEGTIMFGERGRLGKLFAYFNN